MKRLRSLKRGDRVFVHWIDILTTNGWKDPDEQRADFAEFQTREWCTSLGFVLDNATDYLALCGTVSIVTGGEVLQAIQIPWSVIKSVSPVRVGRDLRR